MDLRDEWGRFGSGSVVCCIDDGSDPGGGGDAGGDADAGGGNSAGKLFTQVELDRIVADRLRRDREKSAETARELESRANARTVRTEAKLQALAVGVKADRVDAVLKLADLTGISIGDDGEPDATALKSAVAKVLKDFPEFRSGSGAGSDFSGGNPGELTPEQIATMSMTEYKEWRMRNR